MATSDGSRRDDRGQNRGQGRRNGGRSVHDLDVDDVREYGFLAARCRKAGRDALRRRRARVNQDLRLSGRLAPALERFVPPGPEKKRHVEGEPSAAPAPVLERVGVVLEDTARVLRVGAEDHELVFPAGLSEGPAARGKAAIAHVPDGKILLSLQPEPVLVVQCMDARLCGLVEKDLLAERLHCRLGSGRQEQPGDGGDQRRLSSLHVFPHLQFRISMSMMWVRVECVAGQLASPTSGPEATSTSWRPWVLPMHMSFTVAFGATENGVFNAALLEPTHRNTFGSAMAFV